MSIEATATFEATRSLLREQALLRLAFWVCACALIVPAIITPMPPLLDYPNHYVRLWLVAGGAASGPLASMYAVDWTRASFNIGIDLYAALLGKFMPMRFIGASVVCFAILLPALGMGLLNRVLFRRWHWWQIAICILALNWTLVAGFLNFNIALGSALLAAAGDIAARRAGWRAITRVAARATLATVIFVVHPFGFVFYLVLLTGIAVGPDFKPLRSASILRQRARDIAIAVAPAVFVGIAIVLLARNLPGEQVAVTDKMLVWMPFTLDAHMEMLIAQIVTYNFKLDLAYAFVLLAVPAWALWRRRLACHAGLTLACAALLVIANFVPQQIAATAFIHFRLPCMVAFLLPAALQPMVAREGRLALFAIAAACLLVLSRTAYVGSVWQARQADVRAVEQALKSVPIGSSVLPMENFPAWSEFQDAPTGRFFGEFVFGTKIPTFWHLPTLAIMERQAYVPTLFTHRGKQPIAVLPPYAELSMPDGNPLAVHLLDNPRAVATIPYLRDWRRRFDYALVVNADMANVEGELRTTDRLTLVSDQGYAKLYKVNPP